MAKARTLFQKIFIAVVSSVAAMLIVGAISSVVNDNSCLFHEWDEGVVTTKPTCQTDGEKTYTCEVCEETKTEAIAASVRYHVWDEGEVTLEATCDTDGEKTHTCELCEATKTEVIPFTIHSYASGVVTTEATCTTDGVMSFSCIKCGHIVEQVISATGHTYENGACIVCGKSMYTEVDIAEGESFTNSWYRVYFLEDGALPSKYITVDTSYAVQVFLNNGEYAVKIWNLSASNCNFNHEKINVLVYENYIDFYIDDNVTITWIQQTGVDAYEEKTKTLDETSKITGLASFWEGYKRLVPNTETT